MFLCIQNDSVMRNARLTAVLRSVTLEVKLSSLRKKTLAALLAATAKAIAACFSSHACTESVLTLADSLGWLVSSFAHNEILLVINSALVLPDCQLLTTFAS